MMMMVMDIATNSLLLLRWCQHMFQHYSCIRLHWSIEIVSYFEFGLVLITVSLLSNFVHYNSFLFLIISSDINYLLFFSSIEEFFVFFLLLFFFFSSWMMLIVAIVSCLALFKSISQESDKSVNVNVVICSKDLPFHWNFVYISGKKKIEIVIR